MLLHEQHTRAGRVHGDAVNAVPHLGVRVGDVLRLEPLVDRLPGFAAIFGTERTCGGYGDEHALAITRIENDCMEAHPTGPRLPTWPGPVAAQSGQLLPTLTAVGGTKQSGISDPAVNSVRIVQRWFKMPAALELPRMLRAGVPLM